jgi:murein DD-endopeptidase MepM/ murein hydrolase activator NlpD
MRYAQGYPTAEMPGGDWMKYVTSISQIIKENDMDPNRKATAAGPPSIEATPQIQGAGAGASTPGNFGLTDKVAYSDFSRTAAEGGGGSVGKTSGYGQRWGRMHYGIDIGTGGQAGYGVACNVKGKVTLVSYGSAAGNYVEIVTSDNTMYRFLHLKTSFVKQGQSYNNQVIGEIGNTGRSTGIHLHFEVAPRGGGSIDPTPWLKLLTIGKIRATGSGSSVSSNSRANAAQLNTAASSNRTNNNKNRNQTLLLNQTTYIK